jgi:uncharacterized protein (TIGR00730 family)
VPVSRKIATFERGLNTIVVQYVSMNNTHDPLKHKTICRLPLTPDEENKSEPTALNDITWRIFRIMAEFVEGFQFLSQSSREVTIFGSARFKPSDKWYKESQKLGRMLADCGFTVITGGGPGIMEGANRGANIGKDLSVGLNIQLPTEQRINKYVERGRAFHYFFTRKVMMAASAQAYVYFPGGFGTLDEFFEIITLIQTGKMADIPVVCVGKDYWQGLSKWIEEVLEKNLKTITKKDRLLFTIVDTAQDAFDIVARSSERTFF